jgi:hypothetical protein
MVNTTNTGTARAHDVQIRSGSVTLYRRIPLPSGIQGKSRGPEIISEPGLDWEDYHGYFRT